MTESMHMYCPHCGNKFKFVVTPEAQGVYTPCEWKPCREKSNGKLIEVTFANAKIGQIKYEERMEREGKLKRICSF
jgi:hypothetical protein